MERSELFTTWARRLIAFTSTGFAIKTFAGVFLDVNPAFCALLGYSREQLVGQHHSLVTHPDDLRQTDLVLGRFARGELTDYQWSKRYLTKDGRVVPCRKKLSLLDPEDPAGKLIQQIEDTSVEDALRRETEAAQKATRDEHERLAITLRCVGDAVISTDAQGAVEFMNPVGEALTGRTLAEIQGKPITDVFPLIHETTREACANPVAEVLRTGQGMELQKNVLLVRPDGDLRAVADSAAPIVTPEGKTLGAVLVFRDITEQQKLMSHIQRTVRLESLGVLAGGIAHDFNNLLAGLFTNFELIGTVIPRGSPAQVYLRRVFGAFDRAQALTRQLLTFAKGGTPNRTTGRITKTLRDGVEFVLSGTSIVGRYDFDPNLWLCAYDPNMIAQVVNNLVINAVQAMPDGGTLTLGAHNVSLPPENSLHLKAGPYVEVSVHDEGMGIPYEAQSRIFDPFFTTKPSGVGLGLATSHSILMKHDGTITLESQPGQGTTFTFYLPVSSGPVAAGEAPETTEFPGGGRILIVDDDTTVRESLADLVGQLGFEVVVVGDGQSALDLVGSPGASGQGFRVVFLDLTVKGGMGGKETARRLRQTDATTPLVVVSGYSDDPVLVSPREYGFTDVLAKPFLKAQVIAVLTRVLTTPRG